MSVETRQRSAVVREALSWLGTPYRHAARVKGAGVDCGQLLAAVYEAAGVVPHVAIEEYPHDWHLHRSEELYLRHVEEWARRIDGAPQPGDVALFRFGRCVSHGAIVIEWPTIVHAHLRTRAVVADDVAADAELNERCVGVWSPWGGR